MAVKMVLLVCTLLGLAAAQTTTVVAPLHSRLSAHGSWEDVSMICPAGRSDLTNCEFPAVSSTGISGGDVTTLMSLTVLKFGGAEPRHVISCTGPGTPGCMDSDIVASSEFSFDTTGYYMFNYTAADRQGQQAEDIVFALFLDDLDAPVVTAPSHPPHLESCNSVCDPACTYTRFEPFTAIDGVYGDVQDTIMYSFNGGAMMTLAQAQTQFAVEQTKSHVTLVVTAHAHDHAEAFGQDGTDNDGHASTTYMISDSVEPTIAVSEGVVSTVECCKHDYTAFDRGDGYTFASCAAYADAGATASDAVDCTLPVVVGSPVDIGTLATYTVSYTATDGNNNVATVSRAVTVVDTTPPLLALKGPQQITIHMYNAQDANVAEETIDNGSDLGTLEHWTATSLNSAHLNNGIEVWDECSEPSTHSVTVTYLSQDGSTTYTSAEQMADSVGTYKVRYSVTDSNGLGASIDRTVVVVDATAPIIRLLGGESEFGNLVYEEVIVGEGIWSDPGATCSDYNNNELSVATVSNNVDLTTLGTYDITYSCTDGTNDAYQQHRRVIVRDTTAPTFAMNVGNGAFITDTSVLAPVVSDIKFPNSVMGAITICQNHAEAGFPFKDPSGVASDANYKGSSTTVTVSNNIVTESASKAWNMESCAAIHAFYESSTTGYYFITTSASPNIGKIRVYCDMTTDTTTKVCAGNCDCASLGMAQQSTEVCTAVPATAAPAGYALSHEAIIEGSKMTTGTYVFQYYIVDAEDNTNDCWDHALGVAIPHCTGAMTYVRLMSISDNLPPVITLHQPDTMATVFYHSGQDTTGNPFLESALMAEQGNQVNAWAFAAVGCAVAGIALLSFSASKPALLASV